MPRGQGGGITRDSTNHRLLATFLTDNGEVERAHTDALVEARELKAGQRLGELRDLGYLEFTGETHPSPWGNGRWEQVMRITDRGRAALHHFATTDEPVYRP